MDTRTLGRSGEDIAAEFLERRGYKVLARNWEAYLRPVGFGEQGKRFGEVDIIVQKRGTFVFVEVKAGKKGEIDPSVHVTPQKAQKLRRLCEIWLLQNQKEGKEYQIDVIVVREKHDGGFETEHFERAVVDA